MGTVSGTRGAPNVVIAALLVGCGGSQSAETVPQAVTGIAKMPRAPSSSGDLLYVSDSGGDVYLYSYPQLSEVGQLGGFKGATQGLCVDAHGDNVG
jgi:hypothetical protein